MLARTTIFAITVLFFAAPNLIFGDTQLQEGGTTIVDPNAVQSRSNTQPSPTVQELQLPDPLGGATIEGLLERIVGWLRLIAAPIAAGMIVYGAYQMLFAAGDPEKFKVGRQTILYTVIGYAIIWIAWGITSIIKEFLGG